MQHIKQCKCGVGRFTQIVSAFNTPIASPDAAGSGCMIHCMLCSMMADFQAPLGENAGNTVTNHLCQDLVALEGPFIWCRPARCSVSLRNYQVAIKEGVRSWDASLYVENVVPSTNPSDPNYVNPTALTAML